MDVYLINKLVTEVIKRLVLKFGGDGSRGVILSVFSGCSADVDRVLVQLKKLVLVGYELNLFFSEAACATYKETIVQSLDGFPNVRILERSECHAALDVAEAVIAPVVSMSALSKLSMLISDTLHSQLLMSAITMGKTLVLTQDSAFFGFASTETKMNRGLATALCDRLEKIKSYGAVTCELAVLSTSFEMQMSQKKKGSHSTVSADERCSSLNKASRSQVNKPQKHVADKVLTASHVNSAFHGGFDLLHDPGGIVTPMAKDLARQKCVVISVQFSNP